MQATFNQQNRAAGIRAAVWLPGAVSATLAVALYALTLGAPYIFDDVAVIGQDSRTHNLGQWEGIWHGGYWVDSVDHLYRPLVSESYAIQWWINGNRPWAFHLVNVLLNGGVAWLVAELGRRLGGMKVAWIAGLLFAAHPVHAEAVALVVGRAELMCALFMLAAIVCFLHRPISNGRAVAIGVFSIAAALCKEQGMLTPFILLALAWCTGYRASTAKEKQTLRLLMILLSWPLAGLILYRESVPQLKFEWDPVFLNDTANPLVHTHGMQRVWMAFATLGRYVGLLVWPRELSIDYGLGIISANTDVGDPYLYVGLISCVAGIALMVWSAMRRRMIFFCLVVALMAYAMIGNVILIGTILGERLLYFPSIFLLIALAIGLRWVRWAVLRPALVIVLGLSALRLETYLWHWRDREGLYQYAVNEHPTSVKLRMLLAGTQLLQGRMTEAARNMDAARAAVPDSWEAWESSAIIAETQGNYPLALEYYTRAQEISRDASITGVIDELKKAIKTHTRISIPGPASS